MKIGRSEQLDTLARECGWLYSQTLVSFWRTVRHQGIWLKPKHLMRWHTSHFLHAHTADACVQAFFASLKSWRKRKKAGHLDAKPPHKRKRFFRIEYKRSAMVLTDGMLRLSNGKGNTALLLQWPWALPNTVVIHWTGTQYEAISTYEQLPVHGPFPPGKVAGVDLGEVHIAVAHDGKATHLLNGRLRRSKVQYRNKLQAELNARIDGRMKKGSKRRKRIIRSKKRQFKKLKNQIREIEHKQTSRLITTLHEAGVQTLVIGDVRALRQYTDVGHANNQKIHQWSHGSVREKLTYKAQRVGMEVFMQEESYTSRTCPRCRRVRSSVTGRVFRCPHCGFTFHRDGVGAINIRRKYLGQVPVVGVMAPPAGLRFSPHVRVARAEQSILLTNASFVPDHSVLEALIAAVARGVDVRVLVPWPSNTPLVDRIACSSFTQCLQAGMRLYGSRLRGLRSKTCTIDGQWSTIGSAHLDLLSSVVNYELNIEIYDVAFATQMQKLFAHDIADAHELSLTTWLNRPWYWKLSEHMLAAFRFLL